MIPAPSARPSLRRYEGRRAGLIRTALRYGVEFGARRARKEAAAVPSPELEPAPSADSAPLMLGIFYAVSNRMDAVRTGNPRQTPAIGSHYVGRLSARLHGGKLAQGL
jgi:hypothetical protein